MHKPMFLLLLALAPWPALAGISRWVDEAGSVHFSDRKPQGIHFGVIEAGSVNRYPGHLPVIGFSTARFERFYRE